MSCCIVCRRSVLGCAIVQRGMVQCVVLCDGMLRQWQWCLSSGPTSSGCAHVKAWKVCVPEGQSDGSSSEGMDTNRVP
jgi:hypothetical protein